MSDPTLFEENKTTQPNPSEAPVTDQTPAAPPADPYINLLQGIKNPEGGQKYATVSDALNSIAPKEQHISTLESENLVLREELEKQKAKAAAAEALQVPSNTDVGSQTEPPTTAIDVNDVVAQVRNQLTAEQQQAQRHAQLVNFKDKLVQAYGEKAQEVYTAKLVEAGIPEKVFMNTIVANPDFAWNSLGLTNDTTVTESTVPASQRNSSASEQKPADRPAFRPGNQTRPGEKFAAQKEATMKRLKEQGLL